MSGGREARVILIGIVSGDRRPATEDTLPAQLDARNDPGATEPEHTAPPYGHAPRRAEGLSAVDPSNYVLGAEIARGGMGRIRAARDLRLGRDVAIKEILFQNRELARRFEREARVTARLQHPGIVSVYEAGTWPNGEPFYAMKLVSGRSLEEVIGETRSLPERLALLPSVLAVAEAMAYAHRQRVIHRDLKPRNVLLGEFGETVVIDWGLVKDLTDAAPADTPVTEVAAAEDDGRTRAGVVIGTPSYMSPEQAAGAPVDERADVYAIGAILAHVLLGDRPDPGDDVPGRLRQWHPGVPEDLLAIIERAMDLDPSRRYTDARELAEDLRRYQTGQLVGAHRYSLRQLLGRWARRQRTALTVGAVAVAALIAVALFGMVRTVRAQRHAEHQRVLADHHRAEAEKLMDFMLFDLREKLGALGKLELLDMVARTAITYYAQRGAPGGDEDLRRRATALFNIGEVLHDKGDLGAALAQHQAALVIRERLATGHRNEPAHVVLLAQSHRAIGTVFLEQGDTDAALGHHDAAHAIVAALVARDPENPDWSRWLAVTLGNRGSTLAMRGDLAGALEAQRAALSISERLTTLDPSNAAARRDLLVSHNKIGDILRDQGDSGAALVDYRAALAISEQLAQQEPGNIFRLQDLAIGHENVGELLDVQGDPGAALQEHRAALAIRERISASDPTNALALSHVMHSRSAVGDVLRRTGDLAGALVSSRAALAIAATLATRDPSDAFAQRDLALSRARVGTVLLDHGALAEALIEFRAAVVISERLTAVSPENNMWLDDLGKSHMRVGDALLAQGQHRAALEEHRAALRSSEQLVARDPSHAGWLRTAEFGHYNVGDVLLTLGQAVEALDEHRAAMAIAARLAEKDPRNAEWQGDLFDCHVRVADVLVILARSSEAREHLATAERVAARLADAGDPAARVRLTRVRDTLGRCCRER